MKNLILAILILLSPHKEKYTCVELEIIVLIDVSGSLSGYESHVHSALNTLVDGITLSDEGVRMGGVVFSSNSRTLLNLSSDKENIKSVFSAVMSDDGSTDMASGLYNCFSELMNNGRSGVRKLIIVISDGAVDNGPQTELIAQQLKMANVGICSILILGTTINRELMKNISGSCYIESNYENLAKEIEKLDICI